MPGSHPLRLCMMPSWCTTTQSSIESRACALIACTSARLPLARYHVLRMEQERLEELVRRALTTLPDEIAQRVDNVDVEVHAWPSAELLQSAGVGPGRT